MIAVNGAIHAQGSQFSLEDVEVVVATVDLAELRAERGAKSRGMQAVTSKKTFPRVETDFQLCPDENEFDLSISPTPSRGPIYYSPEEEIARSTGAYLWDYLRRSGAAGYIIALSGGIDSCSTAVIVFGMCRMVMEATRAGNRQVIEDLKRVTKSDSIPKTAEELCNSIFCTLYLGMSQQSSKETRSRAATLAKAIGAYHLQPDIDEVYTAQRNLVVSALGFTPQFRVHGGTEAENLALQSASSEPYTDTYANDI
jgi:NAD+ synthase (glutamine-hydrolysing)